MGRTSNTFKLIKPIQGWWNKIQHIVHHDWSHRTIFYVFVQDFNKKHHLGSIELAKDLQGPFWALGRCVTPN